MKPVVRVLLTSLLMISHGLTWAPILLKGNVESSSVTFDFSAIAPVSTPIGRRLFTASSTSGALNYALTGVNQGMNDFAALAPQKVVLNGTVDQPNPLYNASISRLAIIDGVGITDDYLIAVLAQNPTQLYACVRFVPNPTVLASEPLADAFGNMPATIRQVTGGTSQNMMVFTAVSPQGEDFGVVGSGIANSMLDLKGTPTEQIFRNLNANPANTNGVRALPLDNTSAELRLTADPVAITAGSPISMYFHPSTFCMYVGLSLNTGTSGGRASLLVRPVAPYGLQKVAIAPAAAFSGADNYIVGTTTPDVSLDVYEQRFMQTSTGLPYLIVRGGYLKSPNNLFAFPIASGQSEPIYNGTLASKTSPVVDMFVGAGTKNIYQSRMFVERAEIPAQMTTDADVQAIIGGGAPLPLGSTVQETLIAGDTVFIFLDNNGGVWYSRALFGIDNKIAQWTYWQRYAGAVDGYIGGFLDRSNTLLTTLSVTGGNTVAQRTVWSPGDASISLPLTTAFGSTQYIDSYNQFTPGLCSSTLMVSLNNNRVTYAQTGLFDYARCIVVPTNGANYMDTVTYTQGIIEDNLGVNPAPSIVTISGGVLDAIAPLTADAVVTNGTNGWFCCGGLNGLAILSKEDGTGWNPTTELGANFLGLTQGMSFKKIGNYRFITRLVANPPYLYVATDKKIDRIDFTNPQDIIITTIATSTSLPFSPNATFMDLYASGPFALIASTKKLFRVGNGQDIRTALDESDLAWTEVPVPGQQTGPITRIVPVTKTGYPYDMDAPSNIYVLSADRGLDAGQINRYVLNAIENNTITDATLVPFADMFIQGILSPWVTLGAYRDDYGSDGALNFTISGQDLAKPASLQLLPSAPRTGGSILGPRVTPIQTGLAGGNSVPVLVHNDASGSWFVGGSNGVFVNE